MQPYFQSSSLTIHDLKIFQNLPGITKRYEDPESSVFRPKHASTARLSNFQMERSSRKETRFFDEALGRILELVEMQKLHLVILVLPNGWMTMMPFKR